MREKSPGGKNFLAFGSLVYEIRENSEKNFSLKKFLAALPKKFWPDEKPHD